MHYLPRARAQDGCRKTGRINQPKTLPSANFLTAGETGWRRRRRRGLLCGIISIRIFNSPTKRDRSIRKKEGDDKEWKGLEELLEFFLNSQPRIYIRSCGKVKEDL